MKELLAKGPLLISFYRGGWCPYCNLALKALQDSLSAIKARGVTLVAISPELPNQSLTMQEKNELQFPVLSDVGNNLARKLGIVFQQPDTLRPILEATVLIYRRETETTAMRFRFPRLISLTVKA